MRQFVLFLLFRPNCCKFKAIKIVYVRLEAFWKKPQFRLSFSDIVKKYTKKFTQRLL